ncbi:MAG: DUF1559 domain-containing protein [Planctomycetia bacterium]|nr:DUF1559 domain-containing protein [Planctomycetia bacterium]
MATAAPTPVPATDQPARSRRWILVAIICAVCLVGVKYVQAQRQVARNATCRGRLGQIALALQNLNQETGSLSPLTINDDRGNQLFSWRVRLLPYLDENEFYSELDLSKPWNSPKNVAVANRASTATTIRFRSPNDFGSSSDDTSFVAIEQAGTRRVAIVEIHSTGIHWMEPRDLSRAEILARMAGMLNRGEAVHILTADGRVGTIADSSLTFFGSVDDLFDQWLALR